MKKNKFSQYFVFISIFTFLTIFIYIAQSSYTKLIGPINQAKASNLTKPINPNLDISVFDQILQKEEITQFTRVVPTISTQSSQ